LIAIGVHYKNRTNYVFRDEVEKKEEEYSIMDKPPFFSNLIIPRELD